MVTFFDPSTMSSMFDHPSWTGKQLEEFLLFPQLPPELQNQIWKTCIRPRFLTNYMRKPIPIPIMAICYASRAVALSEYELVNVENKYPLYVNYEIDMFGFGMSRNGPLSSMRMFLPLEKIRRLLIDYTVIFDYGMYYHMHSIWGERFNFDNVDKFRLEEIKKRFPHVRELIIRLPLSERASRKLCIAEPHLPFDASKIPSWDEEGLDRVDQEPIPGDAAKCGLWRFGYLSQDSKKKGATLKLSKDFEIEKKKWDIDMKLVGWYRNRSGEDEWDNLGLNSLRFAKYFSQQDYWERIGGYMRW